jgi:hypothetical protein
VIMNAVDAHVGHHCSAAREVRIVFHERRADASKMPAEIIAETFLLPWWMRMV